MNTNMLAGQGRNSCGNIATQSRFQILIEKKNRLRCQHLMTTGFRIISNGFPKFNCVRAVSNRNQRLGDSELWA